MKIYVLTFEPAEENSLVIGAYTSIDKAIDEAAMWTDGNEEGWKAPAKDAWVREGFYITNWENVVAQAQVDGAHNHHALIFELEVDG
jgi:hypothetical protein